MSTQADVSVCIINWNGREILRNCLRSLKTAEHLAPSPETPGPGGGQRLSCSELNDPNPLPAYREREHAPLTLQVIVVDNASADGSVEMIRDEFPEVALIVNATNRGFAAANNQAAAIATARYLFFLNNDTVVHPGALSQLVGFLEAHPHVIAAGPKLVGTDGKPQRSGRNLPTLRAMLHWGVLPIRWTKIFAGHYRTYRDAFDPQFSGPVPQLAAAALLVRTDTFIKAGGWDESFEFGVEDVDLCHRLTKFGMIHYLAESEITHLGRVSSHMARGPVYRSYQCGTVRYFRKHHDSRLAPLLYQIAITLDTPLRLTLLLLKTGLSRLFGRWKEANRSAERAAGVWFFVRHGLLQFWKT